MSTRRARWRAAPRISRHRVVVLVIFFGAVLAAVGLGIAPQTAIMVVCSTGLVAAEVAIRLLGPVEPDVPAVPSDAPRRLQ